jgi:exopolysaccharide biosynthesis polyprenyl glycosylphosphotransferase
VRDTKVKSRLGHPIREVDESYLASVIATDSATTLMHHRTATDQALSTRAPSLWKPALAGLLTHVLGPLVAAVLAIYAATPAGAGAEIALLTFVSLLAGSLVIGRVPHWVSFLPLMGALVGIAGPAVGMGLLLTIDLAGGLPGVTASDVLILGVAAMPACVIGNSIARKLMRGSERVRVAVIGSSQSTDSLFRELVLSGERGYEIVGRISFPQDPSETPEGEVPLLGPLEALGHVVESNDVGLLLMTGEVPRMQVFEQISAQCLHLPVRLRELSGFYEEVFGHVAVAEINAAWFQWIVHPKYRAGHSLSERLLDIVVAALVGVVALPLLGVLALLIRRDGGPALFRQERIGAGGEPFTILKLRTMRVDANTAWASAEDNRVTRIGRFLRKSHLDELPQIINVLRGEMSIVGPRPEQPGFVDKLEQVVPFYQRRHLMKPGITGWAQVRCGYAGSEVGSAWKVCHDLYYLKHRSLSLNLVILAETLRTLVADPQYSAEPQSVHFILAPTETPIDGAPAAVAAAS